MKLLNQTDNINNHLSQQEVHYLQQKQFANQAYNGVYPQRLQTNLAPNDAQFSQYPNKQNDMGSYQSQQNQMPQTNDQKILLDHINKYNIDLQKTVNHNHNQNINSGSSAVTQNQQSAKQRSNNEQEFLPEFAASKSDPKYQTLPYNTKFAVNGTTKPKGQFYEDSNKPANEQSGIVKVPSSSNVNNMMTTVSGSNLNHMTAHSTPLTISKGLATPLTQSETNNSAYPNNDPNTYHLQKSDSSTKCDIQEEKENIGHINGNNNVRPNLNMNSEQNKVNSNVQYKNQGNSAGGRADLVRGFTQQNAISSSGQMVCTYIC